MKEVDSMGENASEMINKLSRQLERSRDLNDLFITFVNVDELNVSDDLKKIIKTKIQIVSNDKEN